MALPVRRGNREGLSLWNKGKGSTRNSVRSDGAREKELIIRPPSSSVRLDLMEFYRYRHMLWSLVWRDIRVQFDEMYLGFVWAVARPLLMVTIFALFRRFSGANTYVSIPYPVYVYSGLILWFYFLEATSASSTCLQKDAGLISKIYFPRLITPIVPILASLYSFGLAMMPLAVMMLWQGVYPSWRLVLLPGVLLQCMLLILGVGTMFASLSLTNRDFEKLLGHILYLGLFVSPVIFSPDLVPSAGRLFYFLNPMAGTLLAFRSCLFGGFPFPLWQFLYSVVCSLVFLVIGVSMYQRAEASFVDRL